MDFVIRDPTAVEAKAKEKVGARDLRGLRALPEEAKLRRFVCISLDSRPRTIDGIEILPWRDFLDALWDGEFA